MFAVKFCGEVGEGDVRVNSKEHLVGDWANREMVGMLKITAEMRGLVEGTLRWGEGREGF